MTPPDDRTDGRNQRSTNTTQGGATQDTQQAGQQPPPQEPADTADWFASVTLRTGVILIGFVLLLFALGQAVGFPLLDLFIGAVTSPTGRWILVAVFALLLIAAASRGMNRPLFGR